jgi:hypothetical protein
MKAVLVVLLMITSHYMALAQNKNNIYVDIGCNAVGISATYDKKLTRHFDVGVGLNTYDFSYAQYGNVRTACYVDLRPYWLIRRSLLFVFGDIGVAMNGGKEPNAATLSRFGLYITSGFGYCYQINKRGMGPYVSLGLYGYAQSIHYNTPPKKDYGVFDATGLLSVGFKF